MPFDLTGTGTGGVLTIPLADLDCVVASPHVSLSGDGTDRLIEAARQGWRIVEVPVPAVYPARAPRHSYYRPVVDTTAITVMVAGKLLTRGLDPAALVRVLRTDRRRGTVGDIDRP